MRSLNLCLALLLLCAWASAQTSAPPDPQNVDSNVPADLQKIVTQQFGGCFQVVTQRPFVTNYLHPPKGPQWVAFIEEDLDRDGVMDAVIVAHCKDMMADADAYNYQVIDPMFDYHGYGNPRVTAQFGSDNPAYGNLLLIIHGEGKDGWRAAQPKAKFVVINLEFDTLYTTKVNIAKKKKAVVLTGAVHVEKEEGQGSVIYFDGKKYRWRETSGGTGTD